MEERITQGGFQAVTCGPTGEYQCRDASLLEDGIEIGLVEASPAWLDDDDVAGVGCELRHDVRFLYSGWQVASWIDRLLSLTSCKPAGPTRLRPVTGTSALLRASAPVDVH